MIDNKIIYESSTHFLSVSKHPMQRSHFKRFMFSLISYKVARAVSNQGFLQGLNMIKHAILLSQTKITFKLIHFLQNKTKTPSRPITFTQCISKKFNRYLKATKLSTDFVSNKNKIVRKKIPCLDSMRISAVPSQGSNGKGCGMGESPTQKIS